MNPRKADPAVLENVLRFLRLLWRDGEIREFRAPKHNKYKDTASGYFGTPEAFAAAAVLWDGRANAYLTINPVNPALRGRADNRIAESADSATSDDDILQRSWILVDVDPYRPAGISSTDAELAAAGAVLDAAITIVAAAGGSRPVTALSGNGYYALYPVDLPNDDDALALVHDFLRGLAARCDTSAAHVDTIVSNAARIMAVVGLMKVKGDPLPDRPHRRSALLEVPDQLVPLSAATLHAIAALAPAGGSLNAKAAPKTGDAQHQGRLAGWLEAAGIESAAQPPDARGFTWYHVKRCPWHDDGPDFECGVGEKLADGTLAGHCFHNRGQGKGWQDFKAALGLGPRHPASESMPRRIRTTGRHLHEIVTDAWAAVQEANSPPVLFQHAGGIAELVRDESQRQRVSALGVAGLRGRLDRIADWYRIITKKDVAIEAPARPPQDVVEDMLVLEKPLPVLRGIVGIPTFAADGSLCTTPGYQTTTQLFYEPNGPPLPPVLAVPLAADLQEARRMLLDEWLRDFPFVDTASRAHAVAAPLTAVVRELIDGPTPLVAIDAPAPGSGKGLYAESCGILIAGTSPAVMSDTPNEEELRKRITAVLRDLSPVILLDNIGRRLASPTLAAALTAPIWKDRLLGQSQTVELPNRALWLATGNNLDFNNELVRRTIAIRLDARVDRPWERSGFRHDPLIPWVRCHRHELVWALLVLVQHWRACGRPAWSGRAFGSFEAWSAVVGGILQAAGIEGFLANREEQYRRADSDTEDWRAFVSAWWAKHGAVAVKTSDLHQLALADELLPSILAGVRGDSSERAVKTRLGLALKQRRDRQIGGFFLRGLGQDSHTKGALYQLESADGAPNVPPAGEGSANVPQDNWSTPGTNAVPAVPAVPFSNLHAGKSIPTELGAGTAALATEVPQVPHVPQSGTKTPPFTAEPGAAGHPDVPQEVPQRCERCGRPLPANATANRCAGCPAWQSG